MSQGPRLESQRGAVIVIVAMCIPVLFGLLGLAIDGGHLLGQQHEIQGAADAMAMAAAYEVRRGRMHEYRSAAIANGRNNGVVADENTRVTIESPPRRGRHVGKADYIEVVVERSVQPNFLLSKAKIDVKAHAVAGLLPPATCVFALNPAKAEAFSVYGAGTVTIECAVHVDSSSSSAATFLPPAKLDSGEIRIVGDYTGISVNPTPVTGVPVRGDPLEHLAEPQAGTCTEKAMVHVLGNKTISPGVYCGGITVLAGKLTLEPGTYVLVGGGLKVSGAASVHGEGVTFYHTGSLQYLYTPSVIEGLPDVVLSAPKSGVLQGILYVQDRNATGASSAMINVLHAGAKLRGLLYFPTTALDLVADAGAGVAEVVVVADTVRLSGGTVIRPYVGPVPRGVSEVRLVD